jgi:DNA-binding CsgD family transcriptional regulator
MKKTHIKEDVSDAGLLTVPNALDSLTANLKYLGLGVWLAWLYLIVSGMSWFSYGDGDNVALVHLLLFFIGASAAVCMLAPFLQKYYQLILESRHAMILIGAIGALGSLGIVLGGPYYLPNVYSFLSGGVLAGISSAFLSLKFGQLYGSLRPVQALIFSLLSELVVVAIFYFVVGNEQYHPVADGPSLSGILAIVCLPILAACLVMVQASARGNNNSSSDADDSNANGGIDSEMDSRSGLRLIHTTVKSLPLMFWKFLAVVLIFSAVSLTARSFFVSMQTPDSLSIDMKTVLVLRTAFAIAAFVLIARFRRPVNFGKLFLFAMVASAFVLSLTPLLAAYNVLLSSFVGFANSILDLIVWCLLATVVYEKRVSTLVTFGFGRGMLLMGQAIGWFLGARLFPLLHAAAWESFYYAVLPVLILVATALLFSEKEFGRMFAPVSVLDQAESMGDVDESDLVLSDESEQPGQQPKPQRRPWLKACKSIGRQAKLTAREQEIFEMMAFGRSPESIAQRLFVSLNTVRTHIHNIYSKLKVHSKQELMSLIEYERNS